MKLTVACSPHIRGDFRSSRLMLDVMLALTPALLVGVWMHGIRSALVVLTSIASCVVFEWLYSRITKKRNTIIDGSAMVTGMLLAMTLPATVPYWLVLVGSGFAIILVKALCGGLGQNIFNPALSARGFMLMIAPANMVAFQGLDGVTAATPLHHMIMIVLPQETLLDMFLGRCPGSIGEVSALALILGGIYLVIRKVISPRIPLAYLGTVAVLTLIFHKGDYAFLWMGYQLFSGGVVLGAISMATDYATSPVTARGQLLYGLGCGILTVVLRNFSLFPEGVTYAILIMNALVWIIDRITAPRRFGTKRGGAAK